jgi:hypothetical protein
VPENHADLRHHRGVGRFVVSLFKSLGNLARNISVSSSGNGPRPDPPGKRLIATRKIVNGRLTAAV